MAASLISSTLPSLDPPVLSYVAGCIDDPPDDVQEYSELFEAVVRPILASATHNDSAASAKLPDLFARIAKLLAKNAPPAAAEGAGLVRLERVVDMRSTEKSKTAGFDTAGGVDIGLGGSTKSRATVDVKALAKQEAKTRAKLHKRAQRDLYESSKLVENAAKMQTYEEMFLKVNPLETAGAKGKNKDVHLPSIDVNFGSNRILSNATLTLAAGRRYGIIGRNGVGKSTLLRTMALREVPIPTQVSLLYVEQEIVGDDTPALEAVLKADVWRDRLLQEEKSINEEMATLEDTAAASIAAARAAAEDASSSNLSKGSAVDMPTRQRELRREELASRLGEVQAKLVEMEADTGPSRAAALLNGLGFIGEEQNKPTRAFSGGWRMRLALARALFCKPDLLMLDEPTNHLDLNALAWLEEYLVEEWTGTLVVVSHDRAFLNRVATDIVHFHSERLDYYKGDYDTFYETRAERRINQQREYEANVAKREHLQAFIDRWRYNANRAAQAQSRIKELEKLPILEPPEKEEEEHITLPPTERIPPPLLQLDSVTFGYTPARTLLKNVSFDVTMESRIGLVGPNGAGKSTLMKLLVGDISAQSGDQKRNPRLRVGIFTQHHIDQLDLTMSAVAFLAKRFPGRSEQEYRSHLGSFGITGMTGLQKIATLSGGQKSRVAFAQLSLMRPHVLLLDEPTNHLDTAGLDSLANAINSWNGGVIVISHDERFLQRCVKDLYVMDDGHVDKFNGTVMDYKKMVINLHKKTVLNNKS